MRTSLIFELSSQLCNNRLNSFITMETKVGILLFFLSLKCSVYYTAPTTTSESLETTTLNNEELNVTNLFVIREVVYEVGILTDWDNSSLDDEESHEDIAVTFYNPEHNDSFFDLSNIPVPVQTNVSGHVVTGLAPINIGSLRLPISNESDPVLQPESGAAAYPLPNALVSVTTNLTTTDPQTGSQILQGLPPLLGLPQFSSNAEKSNITK